MTRAVLCCTVMCCVVDCCEGDWGVDIRCPLFSSQYIIDSCVSAHQPNCAAYQCIVLPISPNCTAQQLTCTALSCTLQLCSQLLKQLPALPL